MINQSTKPQDIYNNNTGIKSKYKEPVVKSNNQKDFTLNLQSIDPVINQRAGKSNYFENPTYSNDDKSRFFTIGNEDYQANESNNQNQNKSNVHKMKIPNQNK